MDRVESLKMLLRKKAKVLRGEAQVPMELMNDLLAAREANVPDHFLLPFSARLQRILERSPFDTNLIPSLVGSLFKKNQANRENNLAALEEFTERIHGKFGLSTEEAVLAGEGAVLAGLYEDTGAFPAVHWSALLKDGTYVDDRKTLVMSPMGVRYSEKICLGDMPWRKPKPELLIALLAAHVGEAAIPPSPPMWPHLATALLVWRDRITVLEILDLAAGLGQDKEVERGLAIAVHLIPELKEWANAEQFTIPKWERKLAMPLAARRMVMGEKD